MPYGPPTLWPETVIAASPESREGDGHLAEGLHGVGMQGNVELTCHVGEFTDRHDRADLVVGPHHGGQRHTAGVAGDGLAQSVWVDPAVRVDGEVLDIGALVLAEPVHGVEDGMVLDGAGEDADTGRIGVPAGPVQALDGEVVGLGAAGGEHDLAGPGAERLGERLPGLLDRAPGSAAGRVE